MCATICFLEIYAHVLVVTHRGCPARSCYTCSLAFVRSAMGSRRGQKLFSPAAALEELLRSSDEENVDFSEESAVSSVNSEEEDMFLEGLDPVLDR